LFVTARVCSMCWLWWAISHVRLDDRAMQHGKQRPLARRQTWRMATLYVRHVDTGTDRSQLRLLNEWYATAKQLWTTNSTLPLHRRDQI
jgi:hypothetical protein